MAAAKGLGVPCLLATSIPGDTAQTLINLLWSREGSDQVQVERLVQVPHGTGDLLAALYLGHLLNASRPADALVLAVRGVQSAIEASAGADELQLVRAQNLWASGAGSDR